jgi:carbonic anhydrase/acetyltransferase-like protein (isoleucine patch superfamily)
MGKPSIYQKLRQGLGRAFRETGQALDRAGIKGHQMVVTKRVIGDDPVIYQDHLSRHRQQMPLLRRGKPFVSQDVAFLAPCATLIGTVHIGAGSSVFYKSILRADNCDNAEAFHKTHHDPTTNSNNLALGESDSDSHSQRDSQRDSQRESAERLSKSSNTAAAASTADGAVGTSDLVAMEEEHYDDGEASTNDPPRHPGEWDLDPQRSQRINSTATGGGIFIGEGTNVQDGCIIDAAKDHTRIGNGVTIGHLVSIHSATVRDHCLIGMGALLQEGVVVEEESFIAAGANVQKNTVVPSGQLWVGSPARKIRDLTQKERERLHYQADAVRMWLMVNVNVVL